MSDAKAVYTRFIEEVWNKKNAAAIDELVSPNYHVRSPSSHGAEVEMQGPQGIRRFVSMMQTAFPDGKLTVDTCIAEGDRVFSTWTARGTHSGPLMGVDGTGKQMIVRGAGITTIKNGKIEAADDSWDMLELFMQLGLAPKMDKRKAVSRRMIEEVWNNGQYGMLDELVENSESRDTQKRHAREFRDAFPDLRVSVVEQVAEGDNVATSWIARGTHRGMINGIPPTGRVVTVKGVNHDLVKDGRIKTSKTSFDTWELMVQLGVVVG